MKIANWIDAFAHAEGPPPQTLWPFMRWCLRGTWPVLTLAALFSALAGGMEAVTALILKLIVDAAEEKDLGRATLGYVALTVRCVECHSYMRRQRKNKEVEANKK